MIITGQELPAKASRLRAVRKGTPASMPPTRQASPAIAQQSQWDSQERTN